MVEPAIRTTCLVCHRAIDHDHPHFCKACLQPSIDRDKEWRIEQEDGDETYFVRDPDDSFGFKRATIVYRSVDCITDRVKRQAREQYDRERSAAGDPPHSIGNDWLLDLENL